MPTAVPAPDDTGAATFARYKYQAKVAFPEVLRCATGGSSHVILEHVEDIVVTEHNAWRFIQVKSRNPARGAWTLGSLFGEDGPGISLFRSFDAVRKWRKKSARNKEPTGGCSYEMWLEGVVSPHGDAELIIAARKDIISNPSPILIKRVQQYLKAAGFNPTPQKNVVEDFLRKLKIRDGLPAQHLIDAHNLYNVFQRWFPDVRFELLSARYTQALALIEQAMSSPEKTDWYEKFLWSDQPHPKVLDNEKCKECLPPDSRVDSSRLLIRGGDSAPNTATNLVRKMRSAGAQESTISRAKVLRQRASEREFEYLSSGDDLAEEALADVKTRLLITAEAVAHRHDGQLVAQTIWGDALLELQKSASQIDPNNIFSQDAFLILGELCEISDQCDFQWRTRHED